jgi:hypothetical protein
MQYAAMTLELVRQQLVESRVGFEDPVYNEPEWVRDTRNVTVHAPPPPWVQLHIAARNAFVDHLRNMHLFDLCEAAIALCDCLYRVDIGYNMYERLSTRLSGGFF